MGERRATARLFTTTHVRAPPPHPPVSAADDWYDRAKRVTDNCDLELTQETQGASNGVADEIVWVSGLFDLNRKDLTDFKRPLTGACGVLLVAGGGGRSGFKRPLTGVGRLGSGAPLLSEMRRRAGAHTHPPLCLLFPPEYYNRFNRILDRGFKMVIFIPPAFEEHLHIDKSRHFVIHMNATALTTYFPYWDRLQAIRTSKLWNAQADITGWLAKSPQVRIPQNRRRGVVSSVYGAAAVAPVLESCAVAGGGLPQRDARHGDSVVLWQRRSSEPPSLIPSSESARRAAQPH